MSKFSIKHDRDTRAGSLPPKHKGGKGEEKELSTLVGLLPCFFFFDGFLRTLFRLTRRGIDGRVMALEGLSIPRTGTG